MNEFAHILQRALLKWPQKSKNWGKIHPYPVQPSVRPAKMSDLWWTFCGSRKTPPWTTWFNPKVSRETSNKITSFYRGYAEVCLVFLHGLLLNPTFAQPNKFPTLRCAMLLLGADVLSDRHRCWGVNSVSDCCHIGHRGDGVGKSFPWFAGHFKPLQTLRTLRAMQAAPFAPWNFSICWVWQSTGWFINAWTEI
jgi:hypothetical protein